MEKQKKEKVDNMNIYELSYILLPSLAESEISSSVDSLKRNISELDGAFVSSEDPVLIDLAYSMVKVTPTSRAKVDSGYFGWMKFELSVSEVEKIKIKLDETAEVVRYLLIKTVRENTLLNGKMKFHKEERKKDEELPLIENGAVELPEEVKESSSEDLDKSIDDLVIT